MTINIIKAKGQGVQPKDLKTEVAMPKVGDTVLIVLEMGTHRLPRCVGVIQSKDYMVPSEE